MKTIVLLAHGDFGVNKTIGTRTFRVAQRLLKEKNITVYVLARSATQEPLKGMKLYTLPAFFSLLIKGLSFINLYIDRKSVNSLKQSVLAFFFKRHLKKLHLPQKTLVHSWEFFPSVFEYMKKEYKSPIIQDVPIALSSFLPTVIPEDYMWMSKKETQLQPYVRKSFPFIDSYIVPSQFTKDSLLYEKQGKKEIAVIPWGVDISAFKPPKKRDSKQFRVCFIGNVNKRKGIPFLIDLWKELNLKNATLHIYGRIYPEVKKLLEENSSFGIVAHGPVDSSKELPKNDLYVHPSLQEGSAKALYEAMACAMPVITTPNSGSVARDGKDGFIIPAGEKKEFKEKILYFYNNRDALITMGKSARKQVEQFSWDTYSNSNIAFYKKHG